LSTTGLLVFGWKNPPKTIIKKITDKANFSAREERVVKSWTGFLGKK